MKNFVINGLGFGIGDIIMTEPLLRQLKKLGFTTSIILRKDRNYSDLLNCLYNENKIDRVLRINLYPVSLQIKELEKFNINVDYLFHPFASHFTIPSVTKALKPKINIGFFKKNSYLDKNQEYLTERLNFKYEYIGKLFLEVLNILEEELPLETIPVIGFFSNSRDNKTDFKNCIAIQAFTSQAEKNYPLKTLKFLISQLKKLTGKKIIILGAPSENHAILKEFKGICDDIIANMSFCDISSILKNFDLVITQDSSLMHASYVGNANFFAFFGPTDPLLNLPHCYHDRIIKNNINCSPCYRESGFEKMLNCQDKKCFKTDVGEIIQTLMERL